jgi:hypothetical protein
MKSRWRVHPPAGLGSYALPANGLGDLEATIANCDRDNVFDGKVELQNNAAEQVLAFALEFKVALVRVSAVNEEGRVLDASNVGADPIDLALSRFG